VEAGTGTGFIGCVDVKSAGDSIPEQCLNVLMFGKKINIGRIVDNRKMGGRKAKVGDDFGFGATDAGGGIEGTDGPVDDHGGDRTEGKDGGKLDGAAFEGGFEFGTHGASSAKCLCGRVRAAK
jgi:hypothetical protein